MRGYKRGYGCEGIRVAMGARVLEGVWVARVWGLYYLRRFHQLPELLLGTRLALGRREPEPASSFHQILRQVTEGSHSSEVSDVIVEGIVS